MPDQRLHNEKELLVQIANGDERAFNKLFNHYWDHLYNYMMRITGSREISEEIGMDVFLKLWTGRKLMTNIHNLDGFIFRMAHNKIIDFFKLVARNEKMQKAIEQSIGQMNAPAADHRILDAETQQVLEDVISNLSPRRRLIFTLSRIDGLTNDEIAKQLMSELSENDTLSEQLRLLWARRDENYWFSEAGHKERIFQRILEKAREREIDYARLNRKSSWLFRLVVAAAVTGVIATGCWWILQGLEQTPPNLSSHVSERSNDIAPGGNKAVLTLSNGTKINLDSAHQGTLARLGKVNVMKVSSGQLAYQSRSVEDPFQPSLQFNTLTTPRGGQYKLILSDGTKVWLNAVSSIRFPTTFGDKERQVEITGEVYFEVARHAGRPFTVNVNGMEVKVLGTNFNINAYRNEPEIRTTLLAGRIKIVPGASRGFDSKPVIMQPGEQLCLTPEGKVTLIKDSDMDEAIGWKDGLFVFHNDDLSSIMRRLMRWYNVEIIYDHGKIPTSHITGAIRRNENISKVLKILQLAEGAHFSIKGRKVIVTRL